MKIKLCINCEEPLHEEKTRCKKCSFFGRSCHSKTNFNRDYWLDYFKDKGFSVCVQNN